MAEKDTSLSRVIPLKLLLFIFSFLSGISFAAACIVSLQALEYLVTIELGYMEGDNKMTSSGQGGPCSSQNTTYENNSTAAANVEIQERTTLFVTVTSILGNLPSLIVTLLAAANMDLMNTNKRKFALLPCVGYTVHMAIYVIIVQFTLSPWVTLIPSFILGICGNFFLQGATMLNYLGATTEEHERSSHLLTLVMFNFAAQGIIQIGIGYLIEGAGFTITYIVLFLFCALTTVFVFLFLPSVEENTSTDEIDTDSGMVSHLLVLCMHTLAIFRNPSTGEWNGVLIVEAITFFAYTHLGVFFLAMLQIVMLGEPFCWSPVLIGYFSAAKLTGIVIGMTVVAKILQTWFEDYGLIQIGLLSMFTSALIPVYARTDAGLFLVAVFGAFRLVPGPILTSSLSKLVKKSSMGSVFGLTSAIECLGAFLAPTIYGTIYQATVEDDPMFVFKLMAGLTAIPSALVLFLQCWKCTSGAANYNEVKEEKLLPTSASKQ